MCRCWGVAHAFSLGSEPLQPNAGRLGTAPYGAGLAFRKTRLLGPRPFDFKTRKVRVWGLRLRRCTFTKLCLLFCYCFAQRTRGFLIEFWRRFKVGICPGPVKAPPPQGCGNEFAL